MQMKDQHGYVFQQVHYVLFTYEQVGIWIMKCYYTAATAIIPA